MQSMTMRSGRRDASRFAVSSVSSGDALGRRASATISMLGRSHFCDSFAICSVAGTRTPSLPLGSRPDASAGVALLGVNAPAASDADRVEDLVTQESRIDNDAVYDAGPRPHEGDLF